MTFLRVCRRIYNEAHSLVYNTNVFEFNRLETLDTFVSALGHRNLRYLNLSGDVAGFSSIGSWRIFTSCLALQVLRLQLVHFPTGRVSPMVFARVGRQGIALDNVEITMGAREMEEYSIRQRLFRFGAGLEDENVWENTVKISVKHK